MNSINIFVIAGWLGVLFQFGACIWFIAKLSTIVGKLETSVVSLLARTDHHGERIAHLEGARERSG